MPVLIKRLPFRPKRRPFILSTPSPNVAVAGTALVSVTVVAPSVAEGGVAVPAGVAIVNLSQTAPAVIIGGATVAAGVVNVGVAIIAPDVLSGTIAVPSAALISVLVLPPNVVQGPAGIAAGTALVSIAIVAPGVSGGGSLQAPYTPAPATPYRDNDAYFIRSPSIIGLLRATGEFDDRGVIFSHGPDRDRSASQLKRAATVTPRTFTEKPEGSERRIFRTVQYDLTLKFSANTTEKAQAESDRLQAVVRNALGGVSYGGFTSGWRSVLGQGQLDDSRNPEYRITIRGQFAYGYDVSVGLRTTTG